MGQEHDGLIERCTGEVCVMGQEHDGLIERCTGEVCVMGQEHDGLIERWKRKAMDNILELHNKTPVWNDGQSCVTYLTSCVIAADSLAV